MPSSVHRAAPVLAVLAVLGCSRPPDDADDHGAGTPPAAARSAAVEPALAAGRLAPWTGDLDGIVERRVLRALVTYNKAGYFLDGAEQRGIAYEALREFEKALNERFDTGHLKIHVVFLPVAREDIFPALVGGRGDLAAANLTITPERLEEVDFSAPLATGVDEIVVAGPAAPEPLASLEDLAGREIWARPSSSHFQSLEALDARLRGMGKPGIDIRAADEFLETEDLLEMVAAGLLPRTVADSHLARFWAQVFDDLTLHPELAVRRDASIGWAMRKGSPALKEAVDAFVAEHRQGTLYGNVLIKRYLRSTRWVENSLGDTERARFRELAGLFRRYADRYGFDWLLVMAQGFQESRLDQSLRSRAGAVGVMQLLPSTAADPAVGIPDIETLENNVHAGIKYLRHLHDTYLAGDGGELSPLDRHLLAFAAYNAGPSRLRRLRRQAAEAGLDPDRWFGNVERIAAREIGRETVQYVGNIAKYYVAYRALAERLEPSSS